MSSSTLLAVWNAWQLAMPEGTDCQAVKDALSIKRTTAVEQHRKAG